MIKPAWIGLLALLVLLAPGLASAQVENRLFVAAGRGDSAIGPYRGLATDAGLFGTIGDVAVSGDGSFLVAVAESDSVVLRVGLKGRIRPVAGIPGRSGFSGDGGPATAARLVGVRDVATAADGGFLIIANCRVRRVAANGVINTVAGTGSPSNCSSTDAPGPAPGDGGPAIAALLRDPSAVAAMPDGGFLVAEGNRVRRVGPEGTISTVAGTGAQASVPPAYGGPATAAQLNLPEQLAPAPGGGFLVRAAFGVDRVQPDGTIVHASGTNVLLSETGNLYATSSSGQRLYGPLPNGPTLVRGRRPSFFGGWGDRALNSGRTGFADVEPTADGGLLLAHFPQVAFSAPPNGSRLGVAVARETMPTLLGRRLRFRLTRGARVSLRLYRGRRVALRRTLSGRPGLNTVGLSRTLKRGVYLVRLGATSSDGSVATDRLTVLVGGLAARVATRKINEQFGCEGECGGQDDRVSRCRRFGSRRIDCVMREEDLGTFEVTKTCIRVVSAVLRRSGHLYLRPYGCRKRGRAGYFRGRPRYTGRALQASPL